MKQHTILVTGVSSGFGRAIATAALDRGHRVLGTVRSADAASSFEALAPGRAFARVLDLADLDAAGAAVRELEQAAGPIDALVNNAGYGHEGILEESPLDELVRQFGVNVFGAVAMIKAVLLGSDALALVRAKLARLEGSIDAWAAVSASTDY